MSKIHSHYFEFDRKNNLSSEGLSLTTDYIYNEDENIFTNQILTLQSYCNCASINLYSIQLTPKILRELANELENELEVAKKKLTLEVGK